MLRFSYILLAFAALCAATAQAQQAKPAAAFKHPNVDQAWQAAQQSKRPLLLFIHSDNCRFCVKMEKETFSHPKLAAALATAAETVSVHSEDHPELMKRLGVRAYPTTVVISPDGKEIGRVEGFLDAPRFAAKMFTPPAERQAQHTTEPMPQR